MSGTEPLPPASDPDLDPAKRAVEAGLLTEEQLAKAVEARSNDPGSSLRKHLPLTEEQWAELRDPPSRPPPDEVAEVMKDPRKQVAQYWLVKALGEGGMGLVYRAWDSKLRRWVALKFIKRVGDETAQAYFLREAQLSAGLNHPNIASVYEVGEHEGQPFIAMEYVEGRTLGEAARGMEMRARMELLRSVADAVKAAHAAGVIHRDLKPANVMVDESGRAVVMDFGLAKEREVDKEGKAVKSLGGSSIVVGTPNYMPPEQVAGKADAQSDVYGVGAVLYEMATGTPPFQGETTADVLTKVLHEEPTWPRKVAPETPPDVEAIVLRALEKEKKRRYSTVHDLIEDVDAYLGSNPLKHARRPTLTYVLGKTIRKQPLLWSFAGLLGLALVTVGILFLVGGLDRAKHEALQGLSAHWNTITQKKQDLRTSRIGFDKARNDLLRSTEQVSAFIEKWPELPQGYYVRARGYLYLGKFPEAIRDLDEALKLAPDFGPGWTLRGTVRVSQYNHHLMGSVESIPDLMVEAKPILEDGIAAFRKASKSGGEAEAERWGLPWLQEDKVAAVIADALRLALLERNPDDCRKLLQAANQAYGSEEYAMVMSGFAEGPEGALQILKNAERLAPGWDLLFFNRGYIRFGLKDFDGALEDVNRALELNPELAWAYSNRGLIRRMRGKRSEAILDFDSAIELREDLWELYNNRGITKFEIGRPEEALVDLELAVKLNGRSAWALQNRALARMELGDLKGAREDCDRALEINPTLAAALANRGMIRFLGGDIPGAKEDCNKAVEVADGSAVPWQMRATLRVEAGDLEGALVDAEKAVELEPELATTWLIRGRARAFGQVEGAMEDLDKAVEMWPEYSYGYAFRAQVRHMRGDYDGALEDCLRAIELRPGMPFAYLILSQVRVLRLEVEQALKDINVAVASPSIASEALAVRAIIRFQLKDVKGALEDANRAVEIGSGKPFPLGFRAMIRAEAGDPAGAREDASKALELNPKSVESLIARGMANYMLGDPEAALADSNRALELRENNPPAYNIRASIYLGQGRFEDALKDLNRALEIMPLYPQALVNRGAVWINLGKFKEALADLDQGIKLGLILPLAFKYRGIAKLQLEDVEGALKDLDKVVEMGGGGDWGVLYFRAMARRETGDLRGALEDLDRTNRLVENESTVLMERAELLLELKETKRALEDLNRVIGINPGHVEALKKRARLSLIGEDHAGAEKDYTRILEERPGYAYIHEMRGLTRYRLKNIEGAIEDFSAAIRHYKNPAYSADPYLYRGQLRLDRGEREQGILDLEEALKVAAEDWSGREEAEAALQRAKAEETPRD